MDICQKEIGSYGNLFLGLFFSCICFGVYGSEYYYGSQSTFAHTYQCVANSSDDDWLEARSFIISDVKMNRSVKNLAVQSFLEIKKLNSNVSELTGELHGLFRDDSGLLREDENQNKVLDDYLDDPVIHYTRTGTNFSTMFRRINSSTASIHRPLTDIKTIWSAKKHINSLSNVENQRFFYHSAIAKRYIFTWLDDNSDGLVDGSSEIYRFTSERFLGGKEYYFNNELNTEEKLQDLIANVRGRVHEDNMMPRLGYISNDAFVVVAAPHFTYAERYGDTSYQSYLEKYKDRRHMVYALSNHGIVHGFNAGFWKASNDESVSGEFVLRKTTEVDHPLGSEIWAYIPQNMLPDLHSLVKGGELAQSVYREGQVQAMDVNIFQDDEVHPGGWGTILVVGMALGGSDAVVGSNGFRKEEDSTYMIFDITSPELPPTLLSEIQNDDLAVFVNSPVLVKQRQPRESDGSWSFPARNNWYLVFGSSPIVGNGGEISDNLKARLFVYDLKTLEMVTGMNPVLTSWNNSHVGNMKVVDFDNNFSDDSVFFGITESEDSQGLVASSGAVGVLNLESLVASSTVDSVVLLGKPVYGGMKVFQTSAGWYLYGGSGLLSQEFEKTSGHEVWGVKLSATEGGAVVRNDLVNVTALASFTREKNAEGMYTPYVVAGNELNSLNELKSFLEAQKGWRYELESGHEVFDRVVGSFKSSVIFQSIKPGAGCFGNVKKQYLFHYSMGVGVPAYNLPLESNLDSLVVGFSQPSVYDSRMTSEIHADGFVKVFYGENLLYIPDVLLGVGFFGRQAWREIFIIP